MPRRSPSFAPTIVQKHAGNLERQRSTYGIRFQSHNLPDDYPLRLEEHHHHPDQAITWLHRHDTLQIGFCHRGSGIFVVEGKIMNYRTDSVMVVMESEAHCARSTPGTTSHWSFLFVDLPKLFRQGGIDPALLSTSCLSGSSFMNVLDGPNHDHLRNLVLTLMDEGRHPERPRHLDAMRGLLIATLTFLHRLPGRSVEDPAGRRTLTDRLMPALQYLNQHATESVNIPDLAELCDLSPSTFRRHFHQAFGTNPKSYLIRHRLMSALAKIESGTGILDSALASGFQTLSAFNRQFRAEFGCSPRTWRHRHRTIDEDTPNGLKASPADLSTPAPG